MLHPARTYIHNERTLFCWRVLSDSSLRLLDDSRENSFLTNSNSSTVSSDVPTDQLRPRDFVPPVVVLQSPPLQEKQNHPKNRTSLNHSFSSHSFQNPDGSGFNRSNGNIHKSPNPLSNSPDFDVCALQRGRGSTSTPKSERGLNGDADRLKYVDVISSSQPSLSPAFVTGATRKSNTEIVSQHVMARRFGRSQVGPPEVEGQLNASSGPGSWEQQRWKYWEELAKKHSEELHEQQTLV